MTHRCCNRSCRWVRRIVNEVIAFNEGIGGDTTNDTDVQRLSSIIDRHGDASVALVQSGTNDANSRRTANAFEGDMQSLVSRLFAEGMDVHVATSCRGRTTS